MPAKTMSYLRLNYDQCQEELECSMEINKIMPQIEKMIDQLSLEDKDKWVRGNGGTSRHVLRQIAPIVDWALEKGLVEPHQAKDEKDDPALPSPFKQDIYYLAKRAVVNIALRADDDEGVENRFRAGRMNMATDIFNIVNNDPLLKKKRAALKTQTVQPSVEQKTIEAAAHAAALAAKALFEEELKKRGDALEKQQAEAKAEIADLKERLAKAENRNKAAKIETKEQAQTAEAKAQEKAAELDLRKGEHRKDARPNAGETQQQFRKRVAEELKAME